MAGRLRLPSRPRDEARMTLLSHLGELRSRLVKVGIAFVLGAVVAWFFRVEIFELLLAPAPPLEGELVVNSVLEQMLTDIKLTFFAAFIAIVPIILYQIWAFVAPAVGDVGRGFTYILIALASSLFLVGVAFGYYAVLPVGVNFALTWDNARYEPLITAENYIPFVTRFLLVCGIIFELPAVTYVASKLGLVNAPMLRKYRRHALVVNTILAAAITPGQNPIDMILLAIPLFFLYEISILIARFVKPFQGIRTEDDEEESEEDDEEDDDRDTVEERDL